MLRLRADLALAVRSLARRPAFTTAAVLTLALGIAATTAVLGLIYAVLLRPLPYPDAGRLVAVFETNDRRGVSTAGTSLHDLLDWRAGTTTFEHLAAWNVRSANLMGDRPSRVVVADVTDDFFETFATPPALGRWFTPDETRPGAAPVVVVSDGFWRRELGGRDDVAGQTLHLDERLVTVVGVMPPAFTLPSADVDLFQPLARAPDETGARGGRWLTAVGRLTEGVSPGRAQDDLAAVAARLATAYPATNQDWSVRLDPLRDVGTADVRPAIALASIAAGALLLIACANVAGLLLARTAERRRDLALRVALGASRRQLVRHLLMEGVVLSACGGLLGLATAWAALRAAPALPALAGANLQMTGTGFWLVTGSVGITTLSVLLFGVGPALRASRVPPRTVFASVLPPPREARMRSALVVAQVALAVVVGVGAGLLTRSFHRVLDLNLGFTPAGLTTFRIAPPFRLPATVATEAEFVRALANDRARIATMFDAIRDGLADLPGVTGVSAINRLPLAGNWWSERLAADPLTDTEDPGVTGYARVVLPGYFDVVETPIMRGRGFSDADTGAAQPVAIVSVSLARLLWGDEDPVGRRITPDARPGAHANDHVRWLTVVGVAADARTTQLEATSAPTMYVPMRQALTGFGSDWSLSFVIRTRDETAVTSQAIRGAVTAVAPTLPVFDLGPMEARVESALGRRRSASWLFGAFAAVALLLAVVGLYGLLTGNVVRRRREIGIRIAIGADPGAIWRLVVGQGVGLTAVGVAAGLVVALMLLSRLMATQLFGVVPTDPVTYALIAAGVLITAFVACLVPARRATSVDPVSILKAD